MAVQENESGAVGGEKPIWGSAIFGNRLMLPVFASNRQTKRLDRISQWAVNA